MAEQNQSTTFDHPAGRVDATAMPEDNQPQAGYTAGQQVQEDDVLQENVSRAMTAREEKCISTSMTCARCKQSRVAYAQVQTRDANEPMTTFCECTVCGNRWKFS
jgi:DNA-directed RNA polymerase subunit M/transcription elongation factor TFIIS